MRNFITVFEELLDNNNFTIKSFAREVNIHCTTLYAYKNENYLPSIKTAIKIACYFNCTLNYLMGLEEEYFKANYGDSYDISKFYPRYDQLLKSKGIKHFSLSKKIGLNVSSLLNWKKGKEPKIEPLIKIAKYFDVSIDYLIGRTDNLY